MGPQIKYSFIPPITDGGAQIGSVLIILHNLYQGFCDLSEGEGLLTKTVTEEAFW